MSNGPLGSVTLLFPPRSLHFASPPLPLTFKSPVFLTWPLFSTSLLTSFTTFHFTSLGLVFMLNTNRIMPFFLPKTLQVVSMVSEQNIKHSLTLLLPQTCISDIPGLLVRDNLDPVILNRVDFL